MIAARIDAPPLLFPNLDPGRFIPQDGDSIESWRRRRHLDVSDLDELDIVIEMATITRRLASGRDLGIDRDWLRQRWSKLRDELAARRRRPTTHTPRQPNGHQETARPAQTGVSRQIRIRVE
jgi:hypothetical protein